MHVLWGRGPACKRPTRLSVRGGGDGVGAGMVVPAAALVCWCIHVLWNTRSGGLDRVQRRTAGGLWGW